MSIELESKLKNLLQIQPQGVVLTSAWLTQKGYSYGLLKKYRDHHWLESIGHGAMIRYGDKVNYIGAVYSLQKQLDLSIHPGGKTALSLIGKAHFLELGRQSIYLFGASKEKLPNWFVNHDWGVQIIFKTSSFLPKNIGMEEIEQNNIQIKIASPARALMQCLFFVPREQDLVECYELMLGLNNLRPDRVQQLLEHSTSIKVNRLFLYLADKAGHSWMKHINHKKINLGKGDRNIIEKGAYVAKYGITVSLELEENEYPNL